MFRHTSLAAVATAALMLAACSRDRSAGPTEPAVQTPTQPTQPALVRDTVRGIVKNVTNDDSTTSIKLTTTAGLEFTLIGPNAAAVAADVGLEVWVSGELNADQLYVEEYAIRGAEPTACQDATMVDMPPDCLTKIEKLNPYRARLGGFGRPR